MGTIKEIHWQGTSLETLRSFPKPIKQDLGLELFRLQKGEEPLNRRPMPSIGKGVFELKEQDENSESPESVISCIIRRGILAGSKARGASARSLSCINDDARVTQQRRYGAKDPTGFARNY